MLNLWQVRYEFWRIWTGTEGWDCTAETVEEKQVVTVLPRMCTEEAPEGHS